MSAPLVEAVGLSRRFPAPRRGWLRRRGPPRVAVDDVSLSLERGACVGLTGESGSGKTTIARMVAGLLTPEQGEIRLDGSVVPLESRRARRALWRRVQYVHQNPRAALNPRRRVRHALVSPLRALLKVPRDEWRQRVDRALVRVDLEPDAADRYPHAFSGGQAQRIAIARALVVEPDLLVLDEPTSALDVRVQARLVELLGRLRHDLGTALLFISHDLALVASFCEGVLVLREGRIVEQGPSSRLFQQPREAYTRALLEAVPVPGYRRGVPLAGA